jgi:hypothetical protein
VEDVLLSVGLVGDAREVLVAAGDANLLRRESRLHPEGAARSALAGQAVADRDRERLARHLDAKLPTVTGGLTRGHADKLAGPPQEALGRRALLPIHTAMASAPEPTTHLDGATRSGLIGTVVAGVAFFDSLLLGAPIALVAAALGRPVLVFGVAACAVACIVVGCCRWVDRRWEVWLTGNGTRLERSLETMRASRLLRRPVGWIQSGSERSYALAAAVANPILVAAFARSLSGEPVGERRILLGAVAYAVPYAAMWTIIGFVLGEALRAV